MIHHLAGEGRPFDSTEPHVRRKEREEKRERTVGDPTGYTETERERDDNAFIHVRCV